MNTSMTLTQIIAALKDQKLRKRDLIVPASALKMRLKALIIDSATNQGSSDYTVIPNDICHAQIANRLGIDKRYYDKMLSLKDCSLINYNVNYWLENDERNFLMRTFASNDPEEAGIARAFLSDRYRIIDNIDVAMSALEAIKDSGIPVNFEGGDLTDRRMYLRFTAPQIEAQAPKLLKDYHTPDKGNGNLGDSGIITGFVLGNSETGSGRFFIAPRIVVLACRNGMIQKKEAIGEIHLGSKMEEGVVEWSETTRLKQMELICAQTKDAVKTFLSHDYLNGLIQRLTEDGTEKLKKPIDAVKNVAASLNFSEEKCDSLLDYFMKGADPTAFGLVQAVTYLAQHDLDPDARFDVESSSFELVEKMSEYDRPFIEKKVRKLQNGQSN